MVYMLAGKYARDPEIEAIGFLDWDVSSLQRRGGTIPADKLPERLEIASKAPMPDFFQWQADQFIVSERFRQEFDKVAPGKCEYLPMSLYGPGTLNLNQTYYFFNFLFFDQLIDWTRIDPQHNYNEGTDRHGRRYLSAPFPLEKRQMYFKSLPTMHVWRERNIEEPTIVYAFAQQVILMTDDLWYGIDRAFPGQLNARLRF